MTWIWGKGDAGSVKDRRKHAPTKGKKNPEKWKKMKSSVTDRWRLSERRPRIYVQYVRIVKLRRRQHKKWDFGHLPNSRQGNQINGLCENCLPRELFKTCFRHRNVGNNVINPGRTWAAQPAKLFLKEHFLWRVLRAGAPYLLVEILNPP